MSIYLYGYLYGFLVHNESGESQNLGESGRIWGHTQLHRISMVSPEPTARFGLHLLHHFSVKFLDGFYDFTSRPIRVQSGNINLQFGPLIALAKKCDVLLNLSQIKFLFLSGHLLFDRSGVYVVKLDPLQNVFRLVSVVVDPGLSRGQ